MEVSEVLALVAGVGLVVLYYRNKKTRADNLRQIIEARNKEADELHKATQELKDGLVKKKEDYENAKLKVFAVHDGDKSDDGDSSSN